MELSRSNIKKSFLIFRETIPFISGNETFLYFMKWKP